MGVSKKLFQSKHEISGDIKIAIYGVDFRISKDKKEGRGINTF